MKNVLFCLLLIFFANYTYANTDSLYYKLSRTIAEAPAYDQQKKEGIDRLKKSFANTAIKNPQAVYTMDAVLYEEYKLYNYDSGYAYANKLVQLADEMNDVTLMTNARLKKSFILLSAGLYKETYDLLQVMDIKSSPDSTKAEYYTFLGRYYYDISTYDADLHYSIGYDLKGNAYIDSALLYYKAPSFEYNYYIRTTDGNFYKHYKAPSFEYNYYKGLLFFKRSRLDSAAYYLEKLMGDKKLSYHQLALTASTLSSLTLLQNGADADRAIQLLVLAATADIKGSIKETFAIFNLAELLFKRNEVKYASLFIENAIADANAYGARQRKAQVSGILTLIEKERIDSTEVQNKLLFRYGLVATLLLLTSVLLSLVIFRQVRKLKNAKKMITSAHQRQREINMELDETVKRLEDLNIKLEDSNHQFERVNHELAETNTKLEEANIIKEECVSYFFNLDSEFFSKLERLKTMVEKKLAEKKLDEAKYIINSINLKEEKENLLQSFDKVFLRIYPNFIQSFNSFFNTEDQVPIANNGMLNKDLRIFALIRMGITDIDKIARILGYSVNTIYAYKTKIKNKAIVPKDEFEMRLMGIKSA